MKKILILYILLLTGFISCTNLEPEVYSDITYDTFFKTEEQVLSAAGPAYLSLNAFTNPECVWGLAELTTDELILPTRGIHWFNDGIYQRFHKHTWIPTDFIINNSWKVMYAGIANCNRTLAVYADIENQSEALITVSNELRALRCFYFFQLLDLFGNVPIVDTYDVPEGYAPANNTREEVFNFVLDELTNSIPTLNNTVDMTTYARFNRYAALTLLAKLYLNAEVYVGEPMWEETIEVCDSIINSGKYALSPDFFENFAIENEGSTENIFVIPFNNLFSPFWGDDIYPARMFQHHLWTLHFNGTQTYNCEQGGWDGFCAVPSFYYSFDTIDIRLDGLITGLQFSYLGDTLYCNQELTGQPLIYTPDITSLENAFENEGARLVKYDYTGASNYQLENDFVILRYADVLLMKAEALMRQNGGTATQEAVDLVNQLRDRAFAGDASEHYTIATLTLNELLAERARELYGESWRRNDLIRFGKYNDPIGNTRPMASSDIYNLFPIPQDQINANPNLEQNTGY
jgi:hypothetical protein